MISDADRDDDLVTVPRWVIGMLAELARDATECGPGDGYEPGCRQCRAIRIGLEAERG